MSVFIDAIIIMTCRCTRDIVFRRMFLSGLGIHALLLIVFPMNCVGEFWIAKECPADRLSWEKRAQNLTCDTDNDLFYHCILDDTGRLGETCVARIPISQEKAGCPQVAIYDGDVYHSDEKSECPSGNVNCPSTNDAFYSDQLYIYPICFLKVSERSTYEVNSPETCEQHKDSTEKMNWDTVYEGELGHSNPYIAVVIILVTFIAVVLTLMFLVLRHFIWRKRKKPGKANTCNYITQENATEANTFTIQDNATDSEANTCNYTNQENGTEKDTSSN